MIKESRLQCYSLWTRVKISQISISLYTRIKTYKETAGLDLLNEKIPGITIPGVRRVKKRICEPAHMINLTDYTALKGAAAPQ